MAKRSMQPFGPALQAAMKTAGTTYRRLGTDADLSAGYLNHLAHGNRPAPDDTVIDRIADALNVPPGFFLEYRLRQVVVELHQRPDEVDRLYRKLVAA